MSASSASRQQNREGERRQQFLQTKIKSNITLRSLPRMFMTYKAKKVLLKTLVRRMKQIQKKYERVVSKFEGLDETHCAYVQLLQMWDDIVKLCGITIKLSKSVQLQKNAELKRLKEANATL